MAVRAMKTGAVDFIEKPFSDQVLLDRIQQALDNDAEIRLSNTEHEIIAARIALLTPREHEVMEHVVAGQLNKQIAANLNISIKTVEVHRAKIMEKMQTSTLSKLVEMAPRGEKYLQYIPCLSGSSRCRHMVTYHTANNRSEDSRISMARILSLNP